jgi:hypothetical protein
VGIPAKIHPKPGRKTTKTVWKTAEKAARSCERMGWDLIHVLDTFLGESRDYDATAALFLLDFEATWRVGCREKVTKCLVVNLQEGHLSRRIYREIMAKEFIGELYQIISWN